MKLTEDQILELARYVTERLDEFIDKPPKNPQEADVQQMQKVAAGVVSAAVVATLEWLSQRENQT